jgi:glycine cleavage system H protein
MNIDKYNIPDDLYYDTHYQWIRKDGEKVQFGLTPYGLEVTGDVLYLALPGIESNISAGDSCGSLEAGKWVGRVYAPVSGKVTKVNEAVISGPGLISQNPYACWFVEIELTRPQELEGLMNSGSFVALITEELKRDA